MELTALDHLVLTVNDIETTVDFYVQVLGMRAKSFQGGRVSLRFGNQKINLHQAGSEIEPHARNATPGSADICFLSELPLEFVIELLQDYRVPVELGPVPRTGAMTQLVSVYFRDPDGNLIEISNIA